jgi:oxalate decarboxylase/phosphoglucose isomerase-like protein (cupin superfamily)
MMCIQPGMQQHLHYHEAGGDIFLVLQGAGTLVTAELSADKSKHVNEINQAVKAGDLYSIKPFEVHSLKNIGNEDLVILNIAPSSHGDTDLIEVD